MIRMLLKPFGCCLALGIAINLSAQELPIPVADLKRSEPVDFNKEILPILKQNCVACHHQNDAEGGIVLESAKSIIEGGDSGSGISADAPHESLLLVRATGQEEPLMPPEDNSVDAKPLTPEQLGLLKLWIQQGAKSGTGMTESIEWQAIPETIKTSLALAISPSGQFAVAGQGNRVKVIDTISLEPIASLVDQDVIGGNAAHTDLVQSIAISPDGQMVATGGFRTVKLWRQVAEPVSADLAPLRDAGGLVAINRDRSIAAVVNAIGDIEIWDLSASQRKASWSGHADTIAGVAWLGDTDRLVSADATGRICVWNAIDGHQICEIETDSTLRSIAISPDGSHIASLDHEGKLALYQLDEKSGELHPQDKLPQELTKVNDAVFVSQPSASLALADDSKGIVIWSLADDKIVRQLDHGAKVNALAVNADQSLLFSGAADSSTKVWNLASGELVRQIGGSSTGGLRLAYAQRSAQRQNGAVERLKGMTEGLEKRLASEDEVLKKATEERKKAADAQKENEKKLSDAIAQVGSTEQTIAEAQQAQAKASAAAEAEKAKQEQALNLIAAKTKLLEEQKKRLEKAGKDFAAASERLAEMATIVEAAEASAKSLREQLDQSVRAISEAKVNVAVAKAKLDDTNKQAADAKTRIEKATKELEAQKKAVATAQDNKTKGEANLAKRQQALDTATEAQKRAAAAIPSHQALIASQVRQKAATDQALADQQRLVELANQPIIDISVNQQQGLVATLLSNGTIRVYRSESGIPVEEFPGQTETLSNSTSSFAAGRLSWAGDELIAAAPSATPRVESLSKSWQLHRVIGSLDDPDTISDRVTALGFRQDGLSIAIGSGAPSRSGQVKVFSTVSGQLLRDFGDVHSDSVLGIAFAPLGDTIASAGADKTIRLLDVASGETRRSLEGHTHHVLALAWQDDGRSLASASADRTVKIWDVETGEQRRTISGFGKEITAVAFVGTTNQLATACADGQARLYDTSNGKAIRTFKASGDFLFSLGVSFDGEKLLASGQSGVVRAWNVKDGKLLKEMTP